MSNYPWLGKLTPRNGKNTNEQKAFLLEAAINIWLMFNSKPKLEGPKFMFYGLFLPISYIFNQKVRQSLWTLLTEQFRVS